jgi:hypothetical protein
LIKKRGEKAMVMNLSRSVQIAGALGCLVLFASHAQSAQSEATTLAKVQEKVGKDHTVELWSTDVETIAFVSHDGKTSDENLKRTAVAVAHAVAETSSAKRVRVIFRDPARNLKAATITVDQLAKSDDSVAASTLLVPGEEATNKAEAMTTRSEDNSDARYQTDRAKLVTHLQAMQAKGFNPKQVYQELTKIDALYKSGEMYGARSGLARLEKIAGRPVTAHAVETAAPIAQTDLFNGMTADEFHQKMEREVLTRDVGSFIPSPGPLRTERYRIAKAIQYYQSKGRNIEPYRSAFKVIDDLAVECKQDKRQFPILIDKVKYLLQQLGLPEKINPND